MSVESMAIVLHHSRARGTAKLVLVGIANHDGDGGAWPAVATLARYANVHPRKVQEALRRLQDLGELHVDLQAGGMAGTQDELRPNLYRVLVRCPEDCDRSAQHRTRQLRLLPPVQPVDNRVPIAAPPADSGTGGGDGSGTRGVPIAAPEPSTNHPMNTRGPAGLSTTDRARETEGQRRHREMAERRAALAAQAASPETVAARLAEARAAVAAAGERRRGRA